MLEFDMPASRGNIDAALQCVDHTAGRRTTVLRISTVRVRLNGIFQQFLVTMECLAFATIDRIAGQRQILHFALEEVCRAR